MEAPHDLGSAAPTGDLVQQAGMGGEAAPQGVETGHLLTQSEIGAPAVSLSGEDGGRRQASGGRLRISLEGRGVDAGLRRPGRGQRAERSPALLQHP